MSEAPAALHERFADVVVQTKMQSEQYGEPQEEWLRDHLQFYIEVPYQIHPTEEQIEGVAKSLSLNHDTRMNLIANGFFGIRIHWRTGGEWKMKRYYLLTGV